MHSMSPRTLLRDQADGLRHLARWLLLAVPLGMVVGSSVALFLVLLDVATRLRLEHPWLLWGLPVAGAAVGWLYATCGRAVEAGNDLIVEEIHETGGGVPLRMAPLVLVGTVITHLCGGSAGREGTAVQMGGSLAGALARHVPLVRRDEVPLLLTAGIAAGFGGVFGTPVAGAIFALEVLVIGRMGYGAIVPCLVAAVVSDQTCLAWGVTHVHYHVASLMPPGMAPHPPPCDWRLVGYAAVGGVVFGLASVLFCEAIHGARWAFGRLVAAPILRPVAGGAIVIALTVLLGTRDYLGLGVEAAAPGGVTIARAFEPGGAQAWSWWWKTVFTAVTLGSGFKGGEVTPLFFVGATLGNTLATLGGAPVDLMASLGFVAVFAGATHTPIACTVMAVELFGGENLLYHAVACVVAYLCSGRSGIYAAQRGTGAKTGPAPRRASGHGVGEAADRRFLGRVGSSPARPGQ
jgi:H+/Cl- antiporter ClcA